MKFTCDIILFSHVKALVLMWKYALHKKKNTQKKQAGRLHLR